MALTGGREGGLRTTLQEIGTAEPIEGVPPAEVAIDPVPAAPPPHARIGRLQSFVGSVLPQEAAVAVVSCGIPALVSLGGRRASHFPRTESGDYAGSPTNADAAIDHLAKLRGEGVEFLVIPAFRDASWLDELPEFTQAVQRSHLRLAERQNLCAVFDLRRPGSQQGTIGKALDNLSKRLRRDKGEQGEQARI